MAAVRALVISDTHFGAWTGEDILREPETLALLEPALDGVDEVILLGDMFDFMFSSLREAFRASEGLMELLRGKLQGKRFVFLAGNHDHYFVRREAEELVGLELATGKSPQELQDDLRRTDFFRRILDQRLDGVEVEICYPTYTFAGVLCTHGHYLDFHARRSGSAPGRLLARALWAIAVGGEEHSPTIQDYEATITLLTALLYTIAQLPNGTQAQRRAFGAFEGLERTIRGARAPLRGAEHARTWLTRARRLLDDRDPASPRAASRCRVPGGPFPRGGAAQAQRRAHRRRGGQPRAGAAGQPERLGTCPRSRRSTRSSRTSAGIATPTRSCSPTPIRRSMGSPPRAAPFATGTPARGSTSPS